MIARFTVHEQKTELRIKKIWPFSKYRSNMKHSSRHEFSYKKKRCMMFKFVFCTGSVKRREKSNNIQSHMSDIIQKKWKCLEPFIDKTSSNLQQYTAIHTIIKIYFGRLCQRPKQEVTWNSQRTEKNTALVFKRKVKPRRRMASLQYHAGKRVAKILDT